MIAGEQRILLDQVIAEMVRCVAGRRNRFERPVWAAEALAIGQDAVGLIGRIERRIGARAIIVERQRRTTDDRRIRRCFQRRSGWRMVAVGVGADDRRDALAFGRFQDAGNVLRISRARIDHRHFARPDNISLRACERERRRVTRKHPPDERRQDLRYFTRGRVHDPHVARHCQSRKPPDPGKNAALCGNCTKQDGA